MFATLALGQQTVTINQFPKGESEMQNAFFDAYKLDLSGISATLKSHPGAKAIITGKTDGYEYRAFKDVLQGALEVRRAVRLKRYFVEVLGVRENQIQLDFDHTTQKDARGTYRLVKVYVVMPPDFATHEEVQNLASELYDSTAALRRDIKVEVTQIEERNFFYYFLSRTDIELGATHAPFGGVTPYAELSLGNRYLQFVGTFGYLPKKSTHQGVKTTRRFAAGYVSLLLTGDNDANLSLRGGWIRWEQYATTFGRYVEKREGPSVGLTFRYRFLQIGGFAERLEKDVLGKSEVGHSWSPRFSAGIHISITDRKGDQE